MLNRLSARIPWFRQGLDTPKLVWTYDRFLKSLLKCPVKVISTWRIKVTFSFIWVVGWSIFLMHLWSWRTLVIHSKNRIIFRVKKLTNTPNFRSLTRFRNLMSSFLPFRTHWKVWLDNNSTLTRMTFWLTLFSKSGKSIFNNPYNRWITLWSNGLTRR